MRRYTEEPAVSREKNRSVINLKKEKVTENSDKRRIGKIGIGILTLDCIAMVLGLAAIEAAAVVWLIMLVAFVGAVLLVRLVARRGVMVEVITAVAVSFVLVVVFGLSTTMISTSNAKIGGGFMTTSIDSQGYPGEAVASFKKNAEQLVAVGRLENAPNDTKVRFVWIYEKTKTTLGEFETTNGDSGPNIYMYSYLTPHKAMDKGNYKVEIYLGQRKQPDETITFRVNE